MRNFYNDIELYQQVTAMFIKNAMLAQNVRHINIRQHWRK